MSAFSRIAPVAVLFALGLAQGALAHHGTAQYDMEKEIVLMGTVAEWRWSDPHAWLDLEVVTAAGARETWSIESAPIRWLERNGWSGQTLKAGERITVKLSPRKAGERAGIMREVTHASGETRVIRRPQWVN